MADYYYLVRKNANCYPMQNRTWSVGDLMFRNAASDFSSNSFSTGAAWLWECTTGGTSTGNPAWPAPASVTQDVTTVTQNGVVWRARRPGYSSGTTLAWSHAAPYASMLATHFSYGTGLPTLSKNDRVIICVDDGHAPFDSNYYNSINLTVRYAPIICKSVDSTQGVPPLPVSPGARVESIQADLSFGMKMEGFDGGLHFNSHIVVSGSGYVQCSYGIALDPVIDYSENTNPSPRLQITNGATILGGTYLGGGPVAPDAIFVAQPAAGLVDGLDLSNMPTTTDLMNMASYEIARCDLVFRNVRLPSGWTGEYQSNTTGQPERYGEQRATSQFLRLAFENVNTGGAQSDYQEISPSADSTSADSSVYRSGGAVVSGVAISRKIVSQTINKLVTRFANLFRAYPLDAAEDAAWSAGTSKTFTVHLIHDSATNLKNNELWLVASVLDDATYTVTGVVHSMVADPDVATPADLPASTETWAGTGGFSNPNKQKISVTLTPRKKGIVSLYLMGAGLDGRTIYFCPKVEVS